MSDGSVPVSDLEIADRILRAAATGPPRDREPTVAQLLAAFGEADPTPAARRRVAAALEMAGASITPALIDTPPDERVRLAPPRRGAGSWSPAKRAGLGAAAIAGLIAIVVVASKHSPSQPTAKNALPATTTGTRAAKTTPPRTTPGTTTTPVRHRAPADHRHIVVRLAPVTPSFVCVDNGRGKLIFRGRLSHPRSFSGRHIRVNIAHRSVVMTVNGHRVHLTRSPTGYDMNIHHVFFLPQGKRPCQTGA